jgi:hypothetical protein
MGEISIGLGEPLARVGFPDTETWLRAVESHVWHEMGHELFSRNYEAPNGKLPEIASNLLEDIRVERRLVETFGDQAQPALALNLRLSWPDDQAICQGAMRLGSTTVLTILVGRRHARTVSDGEADGVLALAPGAVATSELRELWAQYSSLADDEVGEDSAKELAVALAGMLPDKLADFASD